MDQEITELREKQDQLMDAIEAVGREDIPVAEKKAKIRKLNAEIDRIDFVVADLAVADLNAASRALAARTRQAADDVLANVLAGLQAAAEAALGAANAVVREMTPDPVAAAPVTDPTPAVVAPVTDDPVLMRRTEGVRAISGHLVREVQVALERRGFAPEGVDMIFGQDTADALVTWRATQARLPAAPVVTRDDWRALTGRPDPDLFDLCAQATAAFEGHGFDAIVGDFDGAVLTWGYHGYTLKFGHLQAVLGAIEARVPGTLATVFGTDRAASIMDMLGLPRDGQLAWAREHVLNANRRVKADWHMQFAALGALDVTREAQLAHSRKAFWEAMAVPQARLMGLEEPLSLGMLFDAAIQQGGASRATVAAVQAARTAEPAITEMRLREELAQHLTAQIQSDRFRADVAARRRCFITGRGQVHGATYDLGFWGFFASHDENEGHVGDAQTPPIVSGPPPAVPGDFAAFYEASIRPVAPNFEPHEFLEKGSRNGTGACGGKNSDPPADKWQNGVELARLLQAIRTRFGKPVTINSCYRSPAYNACIGGARASQHMEFTAADITIADGGTPLSWYKTILEMRNAGVFRGGLARYKTFVHVDVRGQNADWSGV